MKKKQGEKLKVAVIRQELVELTGDAITALILNQAVLANESTRTMDEKNQKMIEEFIEEGELELANKLKEKSREGWFYKSAKSFCNEIMISSRSTVQRRLDDLVGRGYVVKGGQHFKDVKNKYGKPIDDNWWKVDIQKVRGDLAQLGYTLNGYPIWTEEETVDNSDTPAHYGQRGAHGEQGGAHDEQGGAHHGHQHRFLHRLLKDNNIDSFLDDEAVPDLDEPSSFNRLAKKEFEERFEDVFDQKMFQSIYQYAESIGIDFFTVDEAERQYRYILNVKGEENVSDYPVYFVNGIVRNRKSKKSALIQRKLKKAEKEKEQKKEQVCTTHTIVPFYNWLED